MKKSFILVSTIFILVAQDDFFEPGYSIGGYGEIHWNQEMDKDGNKTKNKLDFHRFVLFFGYNYSEKWSFKSEIEIEHNMIGGKENEEKTTDDLGEVYQDTHIKYAGELELEQAYINYHSGNWGFRAGVLLASAGYINETHEPPTFLSVERPDYAIYVIPTTWFGNGFGFYGNFSGIDWKINFLEDMKASGIGDGIRDARGKGYKTTAYNWTKNVRLDYIGMQGINVGGSITINDAPLTFNNSGSADESIGVSLMEFHGSYNANNLIATMEYGNITYTNNTLAEGTSGFYIDLGYDVSKMFNCEGKLIPWFRYGNVQKDVDDTTSHYNVMTIGLSYFPIDQIAFKLDYGTKAYDDEAYNKTLMNIGVGYMF